VIDIPGRPAAAPVSNPFRDPAVREVLMQDRGPRVLTWLLVVMLLAVAGAFGWLVHTGQIDLSGAEAAEATTSGLVVVGLMVCGSALYFLPTLVANTRRHRNRGGVFLVNLAFGWTLIGWVVAMIWASWVSRDDPEAAARPAR
jgi:ABC-type Fe3+-siderophore transport system permease subunit